VIACTVAAAQRYVASVHRHHGPLPGGYAQWALACCREDGAVVGVAIIGRPTNRNSDVGDVCEVLRLAADGTPNAPSALLGACVRVARAAGYHRILTYTLDSEGGASLRGAGWTKEEAGIRSWWTHPGGIPDGRIVKPREHYEQLKTRWAVTLASSLRPVWPAAEGEHDAAPLQGVLL
jgi:hypothetical protein